MNKALEIIKQQEVLGKDFKIYGSIDEPLFLAKDVAEWIEHSDVSTMLKKIDEEEKVKKICDTNNICTTSRARDTQEMWFLTEDGLYEVLMQSRKTIAKQFKKEVKKILKQIRQTGGYIPTAIQAVPMTDEEIMARGFIIAQKTIKLREKELEIAKKSLAKKDCELVKANSKIEVMEPKADYYDTILKAENLISISCIADDYGLSGQKLNKLLHEWGVQYKRGDKWYLYDKYKGLGYIGNNTYDGNHKDGSPAAFSHMMWTQAGRKFINGLMKDHNYLTVAEQAEQVLLAAACQN